MSIIDAWFPIFILLAVLAAALGFLWRMVMIAVMVNAAFRELDTRLTRLAQQAPPPGVPLPAQWTRQAAELPRLWSQLDALQRARFDNRKADMMAMASRAGVSWTP